MGETPVHSTEQQKKNTKQQRKPFFQLADDELLISHSPKPHIHRIVFKSSESSGIIPTSSGIFNKLKSKIQNWSDNTPLNYWKSESMTFGLSSFGRMILYVKSDISVFPKEFLRCFRDDFKLTEHELEFLIKKLDFVELEIAHKINDPRGNIKGAKIKYKFDDLVKKLIVFTDESHGSLELELKGDPAICSNLEFLIRDKLSAILYFAELTKIVHILTEIQEELRDSIQFVSYAITFLIDDLLNKRLNKNADSQKKGDG